MTFDEIALYEAIHDTYRMVDNPRSSTWLIIPTRKEELCRLVQRLLPFNHPFNEEHVLKAWDCYGKSETKNEAQQKKLELLVLVARTHGKKCFYANRGVGECSSEVTLDRLIPGVRNGQYTLANCVIACSFHNSQRNDRNLEEYLAHLCERSLLAKSLLA